MFVPQFLAEESQPDGILLFIPEPAEIFWSFVVIAVLAVAFYKFVLPKANQVLVLRSEKIEGEIANAAKLKSDAEELHKTYSDEIKKVKIEASEIRDEARSEASHIIQSAHVKANADAELIMRNANRAIEMQKQAETALKKEFGSMSMAMTQKMLSTGTENQERQGKIVDRALDNFEKSLATKSKKQFNKSPRRRRFGNRQDVSNKVSVKVDQNLDTNLADSSEKIH